MTIRKPKPPKVLRPSNTHEAQYSEEVIAAMRPWILPGVHVHDCFAGPGVRLGQLCDEPSACRSPAPRSRASFIEDPRVVHADATDGSTNPLVPWQGLTSPDYGNGMAEKWDATNTGEESGVVYHTYQAAAALLEGVSMAEVEFHPNDMAALGYRGTKRVGRSVRRRRYWEVAEAAMAHWVLAQRLIVNIKDFPSNGASSLSHTPKSGSQCWRTPAGSACTKRRSPSRGCATVPTTRSASITRWSPCSSERGDGSSAPPGRFGSDERRRTRCRLHLVPTC